MKNYYLIVIVAVLLMNSLTQATIAFSDSFEGDSLDSFWFPDTSVPAHRNSSYSLSTDYARTGTQSLKLSFDAITQPGFYMGHYFETPVQGTFSVWFYDTMFSFMAGIYLDNSRFGNTSEWATMGLNYSVWPLTDYAYRISLPNTMVGQQSPGWHHFQISVSDAGTIYSLDGVDVGHGPLQHVSLIYLRTVIAGNIFNDGSHSVYFDDFSFTPIPEPLTFGMLALGSLFVLPRRNKII
ncbi:MAG TPA: hypothetical protein ENN97_11065 [Phycisphaerales bacterium]|nr:hypothetical protein [Phycisphaerales bacterium]